MWVFSLGGTDVKFAGLKRDAKGDLLIDLSDGRTFHLDLIEVNP